MLFSDFLDKLYRLGLESLRKYYGPYRAIVVDNKDPDGQGKIQVVCPRALLTEFNGIWILPMMDGAGNDKGVFWPPDVKDGVWIFFDNGDPTRPCGYIGGWYGGGELHDDLSVSLTKTPERRGFVTPGGNRIILDDSDGEEKVTIQSKGGQRVQVAGSKVRIGNKDGQYEAMFRGETVKKWLTSHTHSHPWGPTGPSITVFPLDGLSDDVEGS